MSSASPSRAGYVPVTGGVALYCRQLGAGRPIIALHGGPDFDHHYLVPELDALAGSFHLVYYDQRGRGRSAEQVRPDEVNIVSDVEDLEQVRRHLELPSVLLVGHSWGGLLAMEYATRHPERVSHLILLNTAPASGDHAMEFRERLRRSRAPGEVEEMQRLASSPAYQRGDLDVEAAYYRIHFRVTLEPPLLDELVGRMRRHFTEETVLLARAIEQRLYEQTWSLPGYDLLARLRRFEAPALVLHAEHDFVPVDVVAPIADALPRGELQVLAGCGHFSYAEQPDEVHLRIRDFVEGDA